LAVTTSRPFAQRVTDHVPGRLAPAHDFDDDVGGLLQKAGDIGGQQGFRYRLSWLIQVMHRNANHGK
jgi:hypothetical protein